MNLIALRHTQIVKELAKKFGFYNCGISIASFLEEEAPRLESWLNANQHGGMAYLANHFDKRLDPTKLVEGANSVISLTYNYFNEDSKSYNPDYKISQYAWGQDYHEVIKEKLKQFYHELTARIGKIEGRVFVDSAPVLEKAWAQKSGIGWRGKNSNIITKNQGSFFFLAEIISDLVLIPDNGIKDHCGTCTRCIDACPTQAIKPYQVDGSKCISYFTIELKSEKLPTEMKNQWQNWIFGCDICQTVCPWNRFSKPHDEPLFKPNSGWQNMNKESWENLSEDQFQILFKKSAVKRTKFSGIKRNIEFLK